MRRPRLMQGWRGLALGVVLGLLTIAVVVLVTPLKLNAQVNPRQCPIDEDHCVSSPQQFVSRYNAGKYGKIRANTFSAAGRRRVWGNLLAS
jgi:hypothetical protein